MIIQKLDVTFDQRRLWMDCVSIIGKYGWGELGQISLTHLPETDDPVLRIFDGIGTLPKHLKERDFSVLNEEVRGTYIEEVFSLIPFKIGRFRLMRSKPRTCYSVHRDATMRVHLPLITNPGALMLFPDDSLIVHLPANGHLYLTDTRRRHSAMNGGLNDRFHLVGALYEE